MSGSFLWYDLETFGIDPRRTRIAQFAAIRTNLDLEAIEPPQVLFCRPALDLLPSPAACLVTGLSPQSVDERGANEATTFALINETMAQPGTCATGWNTLRFDDEFIRHGLYRNFHDPYAREWANGNSRWDLLDYARFAYALRPEGIQWPLHDDGAPSFRLEHLAAANGVEHLSAHDALSDVEASIGMARHFRSAQPRLWNYHLGLRDKRKARDLLDPFKPRPLLHVSGRFPANQGCAGIVLPIAEHPTNRNQIIVAVLHDDPEAWLQLSADDISDRLYTAQADLPEGEVRVPLKTVHLNRCPALVELRHVNDTELSRLGLDRARCLRHAERIGSAADLAERLRQVFSGGFSGGNDVDQALYDALPDRRDLRLHGEIRAAAPTALAALGDRLSDPRGRELLFRYRARNWPDCLTGEECRRWNAYRAGRLETESGLSEQHFAGYFAEIEQLRQQYAGDHSKCQLLAELQAWGHRVAGYP